MIDLNDIGKVYKVLQSSSGKKSEMQVILYEQILEALGTYDPNHFPNFKEYMEECTSVMEGFVSSPHQITWYARKKEDIEMTEAISLAIREGNKRVVIETLPED